MNNLSNLLAYEIAPLFKSVHLRVSRAESRGHAKDPSSSPHHWPFPSRGRAVTVESSIVFSPWHGVWETFTGFTRNFFISFLSRSHVLFLGRQWEVSLTRFPRYPKHQRVPRRNDATSCCYVNTSGDNADPFGHLRRLRALEFWTSLGPACAWCATGGR